MSNTEAVPGQRLNLRTPAKARKKVIPGDVQMIPAPAKAAGVPAQGGGSWRDAERCLPKMGFPQVGTGHPSLECRRNMQKRHGRTRKRNNLTV